MKVFWKVIIAWPPNCAETVMRCADLLHVTQFIEGMLKNLGSLPIDRIQQMLKFAPGYDRTIDQLGAFMEAARREGLVTVKDGMWKLQV